MDLPRTASRPSCDPVVSRTVAALNRKLTPFISGRGEIIRDALLERVSAAACARLIVVQAPAGFGKSTAMAQVRERLQNSGEQTSWLTLDARDNDPAHLSASLNAALRPLGRVVPAVSTPRRASSLGSGTAMPFTLFIDDFDALLDSGALSVVRALVNELPCQGRLAVGTRIQPALETARHRGRGHLLEIGAGELRFSQAETAHYVRGLRRIDLSDRQIEMLHEKTEGWVTALWLATLELEERDGASDYLTTISGPAPPICEFLADEVLARQPDPIRKFLLFTSILQTIEPEACQCLLPESDAREMIEAIARRNLFVTRISGSGQTYRYDRLFLEFLRARLAHDHPDELQVLHATASRWYEDRGRADVAIDHAIAARDQPRTLALLEEHAAGLLELGRFSKLFRWFEAVPKQQLRRRPALTAISLWTRLLTRGASKIIDGCGKDEQVCDGDDKASGYFNTLGPLMIGLRDRHDDALGAARTALAKLPTGNTFADGILRNVAAYQLSIAGQQAEARRLIAEARLSHNESAFVRMFSESLTGLLAFHAGHLSEAIARFRTAVSLSHGGPDKHRCNAWAGILYAAVLYERNALDEAQRLLVANLTATADVGLPDHVILGYLIQVRLSYSRGDAGAAFAGLIDLEQIGYRRDLPRLPLAASLERGRLYLLSGDREAAADELVRADDPDLWRHLRDKHLIAHDIEDLVLGGLRWEVRYGDASQALVTLEAELQRCRSQGRHRRALLLRLLSALALQRSGRPAAAMDAVADVLRKASREAFVRLFVDEGEPVARLLRQFRTLHRTTTTAGDPFLLAYVDTLIEASGAPERECILPTANDQHVEPLSRRELEVLAWVAQGSSNSSVAGKLGLSESTVRTHLRSVNAKLSARTRAEAVAIARRLDILR